MKTIRLGKRSLMKLIGVVTFGVSTLSLAQDSANTVRIAGSTTVEKNLLQPHLARIRAATGIEVVLRAKGTGHGILDLAKGNADASGASEELNDAIGSAKKAAKQGPSSVDLPTNLVFSELARDRIAVIINVKNAYTGSLTKAQLKDIYTGKITNWKQLGGADAPIILVLSSAGSATFEVFSKGILDGASVPTEARKVNVLRAYSTSSELPSVASAPNAIAVVSEAQAKKSSVVRIVDTPVIDRPLGLVTIGKPSAQVQKVIDYIRSISAQHH